MNPEEIQAYISLVSVLVSVGIDVAGKMKALVGLFHPDHPLTEDQINAIEQAGIADSQKRQAERIAMGQPSVQ
jgi:hypothetical protein